MMPEGQSLTDVLHLPPKEVLNWVQRHSTAIACSEDWQALVYGWSSDVATSSSMTDDEVVALTTATILVADHLSEACPKPSDRYTFSELATSSRVFLINKFGPQSGHPIRDPMILEDWFFRWLDVPHGEALAMSKNSLNLSSGEFLRLNSLKDRVRLMRTVRPQNMFGRQQELGKWYELLETSSK